MYSSGRGSKGWGNEVGICQGREGHGQDSWRGWLGNSGCLRADGSGENGCLLVSGEMAQIDYSAHAGRSWWLWGSRARSALSP